MARAAWVDFDEGGWDLVVADLAMPKLNGWQVIEAIRHRTPRTPIVLVTAYTAPEIVRRAGEYGVPVVAEPFPIATLQAAIAEALTPSLPNRPSASGISPKGGHSSTIELA